LAVKFLMSVFGVTVFAEFVALAASAGERDHELSLSVRMWTLPIFGLDLSGKLLFYLVI
jgi:hypothetical protein